MAYAKEFKEKLSNMEAEASRALNSIGSYYNQVKDLFHDMTTNSQDIKTTLDQVNKTKQDFDNQVNDIVKFLEENPDLHEEAQNLETVIENIKGLQKQIVLIYKQIYGFDNKDSNGQIADHEDGLKDKLEKAYSAASDKISQLEKDSERKYKDYLSEWDKNFNDLKQSIESLLPAATSAGLASAYNNKKKAEEKSLRWGFACFVVIIVCMLGIGISLFIPEMAPAENDYIAWFSRLILVAPLIWIGIYQNKKINISKKIIEEYAHKASMMQTFNGLFIQVFKTNEAGEYISSNKVRETFLLQTLNTVNKNPAECISDCNKSDNPMIDVVKLALKKSKNEISETTLSNILNGINGAVNTNEPQPSKEPEVNCGC